MAAPDPTIPFLDLAAGLAPGARLLGLDLGIKTIGLALSDVGCSIATFLETLRRVKYWPRPLITPLPAA